MFLCDSDRGKRTRMAPEPRTMNDTGTKNQEPRTVPKPRTKNGTKTKNGTGTKNHERCSVPQGIYGESTLVLV